MRAISRFSSPAKRARVQVRVHFSVSELSNPLFDEPIWPPPAPAVGVNP